MRYYDKDYVDLSDFLSLVRQRYGGSDADLLKALDDTLAVLGGSVPPPVIIENYAAGPSPYERFRGLSIYLPFSGYSVFYDKLDSATLGWGGSVCTLNRIFR